jgi:hypothetical protein
MVWYYVCWSAELDVPQVQEDEVFVPKQLFRGLNNHGDRPGRRIED